MGAALLQLETVLQLIRSDIPKLLRSTLSSVIVLDVHKRDVLQSLAACGVASIDDFEWVSQLRSYWEVRMRALCARAHCM